MLLIQKLLNPLDDIVKNSEITKKHIVATICLFQKLLLKYICTVFQIVGFSNFSQMFQKAIPTPLQFSVKFYFIFLFLKNFFKTFWLDTVERANKTNNVSITNAIDYCLYSGRCFKTYT